MASQGSTLQLGSLVFAVDMILTKMMYFYQVQVVQIDDLGLLRHVAKKFSSTFNLEWTHNLIVRLQQNVIRTGLCNISLSYSCF